MGERRLATPWACALGMITLAGCAQLDENACRETAFELGLGSAGTARVFSVDPATGSGSSSVSPSSMQLDAFASEVPIADLKGGGVLSGTWVDVRTNQNPECRESYGAFSAEQKFTGAYGEGAFQESMVYAYTNLLRSDMATRGFLDAKKPGAQLRAIANCEDMDNAYYLNGRTAAGEPVEFLCFGKSTAGPQRNYADDGMVVLHEAQHALTQHQYSNVYDMNALLFDDGGGINEAVSDFVALTYSKPFMAAAVDPKIFSRWALGMFFPSSPARRGAHACPEYDDRYPNCAAGDEFSTEGTNRVTYRYPDGLGWPYAWRTVSVGKLAEVFSSYGSQEAIHTNAPLLAGALWDVAESVQWDARVPTLLMRTLGALPKPTLDRVAPITWPSFADAWMQQALAMGFSQADLSRMEQRWQARGLRSMEMLSEGWASFAESNPVRIEDNAVKVKQWLSALGYNTTKVKNTLLKSDGALDIDETAALWFNLQNSAPTTAGSVELTVRPLSTGIRVLGLDANLGYLGSNRAQVRYSKINGTRIVERLNSSDTFRRVNLGNTYFKTNPAFARTLRTALWVVAEGPLPSSGNAQIEVLVRPANGPAQTLVLTLPIRASGG